ncbi:MAG: ligase-associated DNA damage response endonuclease PdeM [Marinibacterium sp.]|nr:ligase-associated DNA damage response endonuclease PdeM [Marinibacterium sp.]
MNSHHFVFCDTSLHALPSGALWWPDAGLLCVSDLHLGKSERIARRGGALIPPYETTETLDRLQADLTATGAQTVICLGDSFDDLDAAQALPDSNRMQIARLQAGRDWIWIEGNHDPGPTGIGGSHRQNHSQGPLCFRHIATAGAQGEISGHYHPKTTLRLRGRTVIRPALLHDGRQMILPAYGLYTGGLRSSDPAFARILTGGPVTAILIGPTPCAIPLPH